MNENRMRRWMDAVDEELLEEAQRPPVGGTSMRRWGAAAACLCAAALVLCTGYLVDSSYNPFLYFRF